MEKIFGDEEDRWIEGACHPFSKIRPVQNIRWSSTTPILPFLSPKHLIIPILSFLPWMESNRDSMLRQQHLEPRPTSLHPTFFPARTIHPSEHPSLPSPPQHLRRMLQSMRTPVIARNVPWCFNEQRQGTLCKSDLDSDGAYELYTFRLNRAGNSPSFSLQKFMLHMAPLTRNLPLRSSLIRASRADETDCAWSSW